MAIAKDIEGYAAAARRHGEATLAGDAEAANKAYRELDRCWKRIRLSEADWRSAFLDLLSNDSPWVRLWTASHAVHMDAARAVPVLEALAKEPGFLGIDAQMTLKTFREGTLGERN
jgi:Domain of unknown function (DUF2019)